jgi:acetyl/propionyl-CoA carboxylase alpha subunit
MRRLAVTVAGRCFQVALELTGGEVRATVDGVDVQVALPDWTVRLKPVEWFLVDGRPYEVVFDPDLQWIRAWSGLHQLEIRDLEAPAERTGTAGGRIKAPIPGQIARVMVVAGQLVAVGESLLVLEAMKMENEIRAPCAGRVAAVHVAPGQNVTLSQLLVEIVP